jgi:hypothetical protein
MEGLVASIQERGEIPDYDTIWVVETCHIEFVPRPHVPPIMRFKQTSIHSIKEYEQRFQEILQSGVPWVHLSCFGITAGSMLIGIDIPRYSNFVTPDTVKFSFTGPPLSLDGRVRWYADDRVEILR